MVKRLKSQLKFHSEIKSVLRKVQVQFELYDGTPVETLLSYLPCKNGVCDHSELFRVIKKELMVNFALSCEEIENKLSIKRKKSPDQLFKKAVRKFSKHTAKGELGELLLFTILEVYFGAPKILTKIKTSRRVSVFGADAVHAQYIDGSLRLYLGESKLHKSFPSAATKAVDSISNFLDKYEDEFDVIESQIDFPEISAEVKEEMLDLLDPFSENNDNLQDILYAPCFIGFVDPKLFDDNEKDYNEKYIEAASYLIEHFYGKLIDAGNEIEKTALLLLPFSTIDVLVDQFISYMGIKK